MQLYTLLLFFSIAALPASAFSATLPATTTKTAPLDSSQQATTQPPLAQAQKPDTEQSPATDTDSSEKPVPKKQADPAPLSEEVSAVQKLAPLATEEDVPDFQDLDTTDPDEKPISYTATATTDNAQAFEPINIAESATPIESIDTLLHDESDESDNGDEEIITPSPANDTIPDEEPTLTQEESDKRIAALKQTKEETLKQEALKEEEKTVAAKKSTDLFAYNLTGLKEAGVDISKNGFGLTGKFCLFGNQYIRATLALNTDGFFGQGYINKLDIGGLIVLTGKGQDGKYGTADDGVLFEIKINKKTQRVSLSGACDLFGAKSETEIIISPELLSLMSHTNLFGLFNAVFLAEFKPTDTDFLIAAAIEIKLIQYIEDAARAAIGKFGQGISTLGDKGQEAVASAMKDVEKFKNEIASLQKKLDAAQKDYFNKLNSAQDGINHATQQVEKANANLASELSKILDAREKMLDGRKKIAAAVQKVNSLSNEVSESKRKLKKIAKKMKWYEFWNVG
jgi:methyl-accepting chemotaxis protein